jgi:putative ABC transport system permease protein
VLRATLKSIRGHTSRLVGTAVSVVLGVAFLAGTLIFTDTVTRTFDDLFASVYENVDAEIRSATEIDAGFGVVERGRLPEALVDQVAAVDGVAWVEGFVEGTAQLVGPDGEPVGRPGQGPPTLGFSWSGETDVNPWVLAEGTPPVGPDQVAIDRATARAAGVGAGDRVQVLTSLEPRTFTVSGVVRFGTVDSPGGASVVLFDLPTAQEMFDAPGQVDTVSAVADDGVSQAELVQRLEAALGPGAGVEVLTGEDITSEQQATLRENLAFFTVFLTVFAVIALFVSCFVIYNTFAILVAQRTRELALFRALGASRRQVVSSVLAEAVIVGLAASAAGVVAGIGLSVLLRAGLGALGLDLPAGGLVLAWRTAVVGMVVGVAVTVASALLPAVGASRIAPLQAMRDVAVDRSGRSGRRLVAGAVIAALGAVALVVGLLQPQIALVGVGAAVLFVGVFVLGPVIAGPVARVVGAPLARFRGVSGRLARENATRNPTRTARTATALTIGVALVAGVTVLAASLRESIRDIVAGQFTGDLAVDSGTFGFGGLSPTLTQRLNDLPEVEAATGVRIALAEIDGAGQPLTAIDPATAFALLDLELVAGEPQDLTADAVFVYEGRAESLGVGVGDTLAARFLDGTERELTVAGLHAQQQGLAGDYLISHALAEQTGAQQFDFISFVLLADGVSLAQGRAAVEAVAADYPNATVQDRSEYADAQAAGVDLLLNLIYGLLGLAVVIAAFGITNTLRLSVIERTREIGLLRAVGMTRRQLRSTIRWEAVITALLGAVQGIVIGLGLGYAVIYALRTEGIETFAVPSGSLVVIVALAAAIGVLAAIRPARRAARLDILDAIATE